jgi:hypothetical protein
MFSLEPLLVMAHFIRMSWLRVFKSANTAHLGHRGGHEREPRVVPSEKDAARRGSVSDGRHMITACCVRALQRGTSHIYMHFFLTFQEVMPIRQTRNQLMIKLALHSLLEGQLLCASSETLSPLHVPSRGICYLASRRFR